MATDEYIKTLIQIIYTMIVYCDKSSMWNACGLFQIELYNAREHFDQHNDKECYASELESIIKEIVSYIEKPAEPHKIAMLQKLGQQYDELKTNGSVHFDMSPYVKASDIELFRTR